MLLHDGEWHIARYRGIDEQAEHLASRLQVLTRLGDRALHGVLCLLLGLLLVLIDEVDERLDQMIINLAKAVVGKT